MKFAFPNIEAERARLGMSKEDFSTTLGIATKTYYNWINGTNPIPSNALIQMSFLCNAKTDYLLGLCKER
ncbi:MAG: helix-turn-helix transcriptional regulator [Lachnospiraceae bacterium]|nr:helix-turn-helix transcriptional regulator [Lachnospiraceae bacterium]